MDISSVDSTSGRNPQCLLDVMMEIGERVHKFALKKNCRSTSPPRTSKSSKRWILDSAFLDNVHEKFSHQISNLHVSAKKLPAHKKLLACLVAKEFMKLSWIIVVFVLPPSTTLWLREWAPSIPQTTLNMEFRLFFLKQGQVRKMLIVYVNDIIAIVYHTREQHPPFWNKDKYNTHRLSCTTLLSMLMNSWYYNYSWSNKRWLRWKEYLSSI